MKTILITGCRRGIGFELVKQLVNHRNGPEIIITTVRNISDADELMTLAKAHPKIKVLELDNNDYGKMDEFAKKVDQIVGEDGLNVLLNNAGMLNTSKTGTIEELTADQMIQVFKNNTVGPIMLTKSLLPLLRRASQVNSDKDIGSDRAAIFFISSFLGSHTLNDRGGCWGYRESKASVNMAAITLKVELEKDGIGTKCFHPGWVKTDMGGEGAQVELSESIGGIIKQIMEFSKASNGTFFRWDGMPIPW